MGKFIRKDSKFVVYKITNIVNSMMYIGITGDYKRRMRDHFACNCENSYLHQAIKKYGKYKFQYKIICRCNLWKDLCQKEIEYIDQLNTKRPNGYNLTNGGEGIVGFKWSVKSRVKLSSIAKTRSIETRKKMSEAQIGKKLSEEHKKKISEGGKGLKRSTLTRQRMSKPKSEKAKVNMKKHNGKARIVIIDGKQFSTITEAAIFLNIPISTLTDRLRNDRNALNKENYESIQKLPKIKTDNRSGLRV